MVFSRQIVSVITACVLSVHVVVGCCAHHAHSLASAPERAEAAHTAYHEHDSHDACHHHSSDRAAPSDDGRPCDHSCDQGSCAFLAGTKIVLPDLAQPAEILTADSTALLNQLTPSSVAADLLPDRAILPPVRSHLRKCVLLV